MRIISILLLICFLGASCSPYTSPANNKRYQKHKQQGPDFPMGPHGDKDCGC